MGAGVNTVIDILGSIPWVLELLILIAAAVGAWVALRRTVYLPLMRHFSRVNAGMDTLLGYPPVLDPGSGRVIQPATPPLAARVYDLEESNTKMADALEVLADNQRRILRLEDEWAERKRVGEQIIADFTEWRAHVDATLQAWIEEQDTLARLIRENNPGKKGVSE